MGTLEDYEKCTVQNNKTIYESDGNNTFYKTSLFSRFPKVYDYIIIFFILAE